MPSSDEAGGRPAPAGRVIILLATFNGGAYLNELIATFSAQTHQDWLVLWRDDGSSDDTVALLEAFTADVGPARCRRLATPFAHLGAAASFLALLRAALPLLGPRDAVAFADQDDVWLGDKLARGMAALGGVAAGRPALSCARQYLVDAQLNLLGQSPAIRRPPGFPAALAQNIATGCTILLNRPAAALVAGSAPPPTLLHDWWSYVLVTAAGGAVLVDPVPTVLYRQHGGNAVGAPAGLAGRARGAIRRGPGTFMRLFRDTLGALAARPELLTQAARADVARLRAALAGGRLRRLAALAMPGLSRQTVLETWAFRLWFLLG